MLAAGPYNQRLRSRGRGGIAVSDGQLVLRPVPGIPASSLSALALGPGEPVTLGRSPQCGARVDHAGISREHARIHASDGAWYVTDLGSRNGTFVNGWKLPADEPVMVHEGDVLGLGSCELYVTFPGRRAVAASEPKPDALATSPSIFLRLGRGAPGERELAWEEFHRRYAPIVVGFSRNAGLPAQEADDVLQDVMLGFYRHSPEFHYDPAKGHFRGYLKRATLNAIRKRRRAAAIQAVAQAILEEQEDEANPEWDRHWEEQQMTRAVEEARRRFDPRTFEAFELYALRGVPAETVAAQLGMSLNSVQQAKSRVLRIVRSIAETLSAHEG